MPARSYSFTCGGVAFFGLDTSGCQYAVQRRDSTAQKRLVDDVAALGKALESTSLPKIVFGHHTLYTKGRGHGAEAKCLRLQSYSFREREGDSVTKDGFGLGRVLAAGGATAYFSGHEHVFQSHPDPAHPDGVAAFCIGASAESGYYCGENTNEEDSEHWPAWVDRSGSTGFAQVEVWHDRLKVTLVACSDLPDPHPVILRVDTIDTASSMSGRPQPQEVSTAS
jgi:hypothetical protein